MSYDIMLLTAPSENAMFTTAQARKIALAPLNGPSFEHESAKVYGIKQRVLEGPDGCA